MINSSFQFFNSITDRGEIPTQLKTAIVTPIYKSGSRNDMNNYRPISVLPIVSKIMEKIVAYQFLEYLVENNLLSPHQYGFRPKHSTTTSLIQLTEDIRTGLDRNEATGMVALDISKAFDTIDHSILLTKLKLTGCDNGAMKFFTNYLSNRSQIVKICNKMSPEK